MGPAAIRHNVWCNHHSESNRALPGDLHSKAESSPVFQPIVPLTPQWSDLPAFPVDALPDVVRNYVSAVAEHSQTAPDMAAVISLGVLAICLQENTR